MEKKSIFKRNKESGTQIATAPEEPETNEESVYTEQLESGEESQAIEQPRTTEEPVKPMITEQPKVIPVPVYVSQAQVNEMVIQNNQMLKELYNEVFKE